MDLSEKLKALAEKAEANKTTLSTEEATKNALIMPFFHALGYDVFNPQEFIPEYIADVGEKKGEKVDYAIIIDEQPKIIVETKMVGIPLDKFVGQLARYYAFTNSKFGILTDGIEYRFFTDIDEPNKMDRTPFFTFRITDLRQSDIAEIEKFQKSTFNANEVFAAAEDLKYTSAIENFVKTQFATPNDDFVKYLISKVYNGKRVQSAIDKFKPIVKKSLNQLIEELVNERLTQALTREKPAVETSTPPEQQNTPVDARIETTQEEIDAYNVIKSILKNILPADKISYNDTVYYFSINFGEKRTDWICRLALKDKVKYIVIPSNDADARKHNIGYGKRYELENVNSLYNLADLIKESAKRFV